MIFLQIHSTPFNGPSTVFDINYDASSLIENASRHVCRGIEKRGEPNKEGEGKGIEGEGEGIYHISF